MQYLCIYKPAKHTPPTPQHMEQMGKLIDEMFRNGTLVSTGALLPSANDARVRLADGAFEVTDGPFAESKELVGGFAILNAKSKADAIALTKQFLAIAGDGTSQIHQVAHEPPGHVD
jgi:hypothetical protein